jgi:hypothetical protein
VSHVSINKLWLYHVLPFLTDSAILELPEFLLLSHMLPKSWNTLSNYHSIHDSSHGYGAWGVSDLSHRWLCDRKLRNRNLQQSQYFGLVFIADIFIDINARNHPNRVQSIEFLSMLIRIIIQIE